MKKISILFILILLLSACKRQTYTVTFLDGGESILTVEVTKGEPLEDVENPIKEGYIFMGWAKNGFEYNMNKPVNEDMTLEATWVAEPNPVKTYIVTFDFGDEIRTVSVKEGEKVSVPKKVPKKEKHKFLGWYDGDTKYDFNNPVTKDVTLMAKFEKNRLIVKYDLDGGTGTVEVEIEKGTIPNRPSTPLKFGYTFTYWTIDDERYNFDKPLSKDTTIKANYEANIYYKVTFDTDGGSEINSQMIIAGKTVIELPTPEKEGYTFLYWEYNGEKFDSETNITEDITLIARYKQNEE